MPVCVCVGTMLMAYRLLFPTIIRRRGRLLVFGGVAILTTDAPCFIPLGSALLVSLQSLCRESFLMRVYRPKGCMKSYHAPLLLLHRSSPSRIPALPVICGLLSKIEVQSLYFPAKPHFFPVFFPVFFSLNVAILDYFWSNSALLVRFGYFFLKYFIFSQGSCFDWLIDRLIDCFHRFVDLLFWFSDLLFSIHRALLIFLAWSNTFGCHWLI